MLHDLYFRIKAYGQRQVCKEMFFPSLVWETSMHRALTSNLFLGMNWDTDWKPNLIVKHQWSTSSMNANKSCSQTLTSSGEIGNRS